LNNDYDLLGKVKYMKGKFPQTPDDMVEYKIYLNSEDHNL